MARMIEKKWRFIVAKRLYVCIKVANELWYNTTECGKTYHLFHLGWITYNGLSNKVFALIILNLSIHVSFIGQIK